MERTILDTVTAGFTEDPAMPVIPFSAEVKDGQCAEMHAHPRAQLIYASNGLMKVLAADQVWMVTSSQAIWVPGQVAHQVHFLGNVCICNLFFDSTVTGTLPKTCFAFEVNTFLKELIMRVTSYIPGSFLSSQKRITEVLLDELSMLVPSTLFLPMAKETRLAKLLELILADLSRTYTLAELADSACVSTKTLQRLFVTQTGMAYVKWRRRAVLQEAICQMKKGKSVSQLATELGYEHPSAFSSMFRQELGKTPGQYMLNSD